jgi:hypothetical protein
MLVPEISVAKRQPHILQKMHAFSVLEDVKSVVRQKPR